MKKLLVVCVLTVCGLTTVYGQTNPTPVVLDNVNGQWNTPAINKDNPVLPANMAVHTFNAKPAAVTVTPATANGTMSPHAADMSAGGFFAQPGIGFYNQSIYIQGNAAKNIGAIVYAFDTRHRSDIAINVPVTRISNGTGINGLRFQYRLSTSGNFTNLSASAEYLSDVSTATVDITLPVAAENKPVVQIRVLYFDLVAGTYDAIGVGRLLLTSERTSPQVSTGAITNRQAYSVSVSGNVTALGTYPAVTERGIVFTLWGIGIDPTITNSTKVAAGSGVGTFTTGLTGLSAHYPVSGQGLRDLFGWCGVWRIDRRSDSCSSLVGAGY
jgi:hypothetical protein